MSEALLEGRTVLISGGAGGIGSAAARLLAACGARTAIFDRDRERSEEVIGRIREEGGEARFVAGDASSPEDVRRAVEEATRPGGRLDVLVNAVGGSGRRWGDGPVAECTEEAWARVLEMNLTSVFLCCRYALPRLIETGSGSIVNVSSVLGLVGGDENFATHAYAAAKGGVVSLTRALALYYAPRGVRANVVCPGLVDTPMSERARSDPKIQSSLPRLQPLTGEPARPEQVAQAILFLASPRSSFITGAVLPVDGGWTAG